MKGGGHKVVFSMKHILSQAPDQGSDTIPSTLLRTCVQPKWSTAHWSLTASKGINEAPVIIARLFFNLFPTSSSLQNCYFNLKGSRNEALEWSSGTQVISLWVQEQLLLVLHRLQLTDTQRSLDAVPHCLFSWGCSCSCEYSKPYSAQESAVTSLCSMLS